MIYVMIRILYGDAPVNNMCYLFGSSKTIYNIYIDLIKVIIQIKYT